MFISAVVRCWKLKVFNVQREAKISHTLSVASWWKLFLSSPTQLALKHSDVQRFFFYCLYCKYRENVNKGLITSSFSCMSRSFYCLCAVFVTCQENLVVILGTLFVILTGNCSFCLVGSDDSDTDNDVCISVLQHMSYWVRSSGRKVSDCADCV